MRNNFRWLLFLLILAGTCVIVMAQTRPYTPRHGSAERKALMDALRPLVERDFEQEVVFVVSRLKVQDGWAFMLVTPQRPDGRAVDYSQTRYASEYEAGMMSDLVIALLRKQRGRWRVVEYVLGPTDVPYEGWPRRHKAPRAIFDLPD